MLFAAPPAVEVSYGREVAPILAMRCHSCHGDAGGLNTRSYRELMAGGNKGKVILPGNASGSLLVQFIDGRRGEAHRMPLGGQPLTASQMEVIRKWIDTGARNDGRSMPAYTRKLTNVSWPAARKLQVSFRLAVEAYLVLRLYDAQTRRALAEREGPVKKIGEEPDLGTVGRRVSVEFDRGEDWPGSVEVELRLEYVAVDPGDVELRVSLTK